MEEEEEAAHLPALVDAQRAVLVVVLAVVLAVVLVASLELAVVLVQGPVD